METLDNFKKDCSNDVFFALSHGVHRGILKSGKKDVTLPMPLPVKWAGEIPVISMQNFTIPGLGTFSAHVVIDRGKYAGTWAHGNKGGHLYGTIHKIR